MGKLFVVVCFAVFILIFAVHFFPGLAHTAFTIGSFGVSWTMLCFVMLLGLGLKLAD